MTPADTALAEAIRCELWHRPLRVSISGLDGAGKSTLCGTLSAALGLPVVRVPDRARVAAHVAAGADRGAAQLLALQAQLIEAPSTAILDRGPLCVAAIHPEVAGLAQLLAGSQYVMTLYLHLPLADARGRKADLEAELRNRELEAARYRSLAARWPRTLTLDARHPPEAVLSAALRAVAEAVGVAVPRAS